MRVEITEEIRKQLESEAERTGVGASKLMRGRRTDMPQGLTSSMMNGWKNGAIGSAKKAHLDWVLKAYAEWTQPAKPDIPKKIMLTDEHRAFIQSEAERTGLGAVAILRHATTNLPEGLNHQKVQRWISGQTKSAKKAHWDLVIRLYAMIET
ncbi:hypothetical protein [Aurantiacibacter sp. D1-12]|uniref:hypothetical protein n=1 Tax=Aurantiacibacter sp. D1-12 TaxID=2993658 RepID=UPI00237C6058|nr:hypothetical protein [Aurantiacibacter sp. D1-12]MDE1466915.1 hypothetical protein [Aurantiacibacter sp. D1-12]